MKITEIKLELGNKIRFIFKNTIKIKEAGELIEDFYPISILEFKIYSVYFVFISSTNIIIGYVYF